MPWDTVYIVFNFTPKENYNLFRLNRTFTKLIEKRRLGLTFSKPDITPSIFFELLKKSQQTLKFLKISANLKYIKPREFDDRMIKPRQLIHLDLVCFNAIGETALSRIIDVSFKSLKSFKVKYSNPGLTQMTCKRLTYCKVLDYVEFG